MFSICFSSLIFCWSGPSGPPLVNSTSPLDLVNSAVIPGRNLFISAYVGATQKGTPGIGDGIPGRKEWDLMGYEYDMIYMIILCVYIYYIIYYNIYYVIYIYIYVA